MATCSGRPGISHLCYESTCALKFWTNYDGYCHRPASSQKGLERQDSISNLTLILVNLIWLSPLHDSIGEDDG